MRFMTATLLLAVATSCLALSLSANAADGSTLMGYGVNLDNHSWNLQAYNMGYDLNGCARLCENEGRCVAWQLQGDGSQTQYTCRLLEEVRGAPRPMPDTFFGFSSRYR
jgi:hypothetical protein